MSTLYLCGATNPEGVRLALQVGRHSSRWSELRILDDDPRTHGRSILGVPVTGSFAELEAASREDEVVNLVARTTRGREGARGAIARYGLRFASLVHPSVDTEGVELGEGVTVYANATLCASSFVGEGSVVFMNAVVGHGARVGTGCVIAAGAVLNARVELEELVYVGTNASVLPDLRLGRLATVAANSVVIADVEASTTVLGVPGEHLPASVPEPGEEARDRSVIVPLSVASVSETALEDLVSGIWAEILGRDGIGVHENFFGVGGTSLAALQLRERMSSALGRHVPVTLVYQYPTIRSLSRAMSTLPAEEEAPRERRPVRRGLARRPIT